MYLFNAIRYGYFAVWPTLALILKEDGNFHESLRFFHRGLYHSDRNGFASTYRMVSRVIIKDKFFVRYYTNDAWVYYTYYGLPSRKEDSSLIENSIPFFHCLKDVFMGISPIAFRYRHNIKNWLLPVFQDYTRTQLIESKGWNGLFISAYIRWVQDRSLFWNKDSCLLFAVQLCFGSIGCHNVR